MAVRFAVLPRRERATFASAIDWGSFYWVPSDVFGAGKVLVFGEVIAKDGKAVFRRHSRSTQELCQWPFRQEGLHAECGQRDRGISLQGH